MSLSLSTCSLFRFVSSLSSILFYFFSPLPSFCDVHGSNVWDSVCGYSYAKSWPCPCICRYPDACGCVVWGLLYSLCPILSAFDHSLCLACVRLSQFILRAKKKKKKMCVGVVCIWVGFVGVVSSVSFSLPTRVLKHPSL